MNPFMRSFKLVIATWVNRKTSRTFANYPLQSACYHVLMIFEKSNIDGKVSVCAVRSKCPLFRTVALMLQINTCIIETARFIRQSTNRKNIAVLFNIALNWATIHQVRICEVGDTWLKFCFLYSYDIWQQ